MTKIRKTFAGVSAALLLAATASVAFAGGPHHGGKGDPARMMERMTRALELTPDQQEKIKAITHAHREELKAVHQRIREQRQAVAEGSKHGFDEARVRAEADTLGDLIADATVLMSRMQADVREVLTPEQQTKLDEMRERGPRKTREHRQEN